MSANVSVASPQDRLFTAPFLWILATNFFAIFNLNLFILLPSFVRGLGGDEASIGLLMGMHSVVALLARIWLGGWLDRYGRRPFIFIGVGFSVVSTIGYFLVDSVGPLLYACRALHGLGFACYFTAMLTLTADTVPGSRRTQALAWTGVAGFAANAIAPLAGEFVLALGGVQSDVTRAYHGLFLFALAIIGMAAAFTPRTHPAPYDRGVATNVFRLLQHRAMRVVMVPTMAMGIGFGTAFMFMKDYGATRGLQNVGAFFATYSVVVVSLRVGAGRMLDRVDRRAIIYPSLSVLALGVLLQTQLTHAGWLVLLGLLCGGGHGLLYPTLSAMAYEAVPAEQRGGAMALYTMGFDGGLALGTIPLGVVARQFGYPTMYLTGGGITLLGLVAFAAFTRPGARARTAPG